MNYNKAILGGRLTRDPQLSSTPAQTPKCEFGIAVNDVWKDKEGNKKEDVCFIECTAWGKTGEVINQYFAKGQEILVEGRIKFSTWERDGQKRSKHTIAVQSFEFLGGKNDAPQNESYSDGGIRQPAPQAPQQSNYSNEPTPPAQDDVTSGDIPF